MEEAKEKILYDKYPELFGQKDLSMQETCMCWGIDCGNGWFEILDQMCKELQALKQPLQFTQIKEKFGTLRVYTNHCSDESEHIISKACDSSENTCEMCGQPGKLDGKTWLSTRCTVCKKGD